MKVTSNISNENIKDMDLMITWGDDPQDRVTTQCKEFTFLQQLKEKKLELKS